MKGDFTRRTFRRSNHYRAVLMQQGRVQLDADWNEQHDIQRHHDEISIRDAIGRCGAPVDGAGFAITDQLEISAGRYYVDGILCENDEPIPLFAQPDLPDPDVPAESGEYIAYLDVWREHVTALEAPGLREPALGGIDTGTRIRTTWQVRLAPREADPPSSDWIPPEARTPAGQLRARTDPGYQRPTNQLYRVEIHDAATFLWSRENGTIVDSATQVAPLVFALGGSRPELADAFSAGDLVEITSVDRGRRGQPGFLAHVDTIDGPRLTVSESPPEGTLTGTVTVRRWDCATAAGLGPGWLPLEDGIQVQFTAGEYRTGDYWTIPARTATPLVDLGTIGDIEWPVVDDEPVAFPPEGVEHHYAAIALVQLTNGSWRSVRDLRRQFLPLSDERPEPMFQPEPGLHVTTIYLTAEASKRRLDYGSQVTPAQLSGGLTVELDAEVAGPPDGWPPMITVLVDEARAGTTQPVTLIGAVAVSGRILRWAPVPEAIDWLHAVTAPTFCHVRVHGALVVSVSNPPLMLNGFARTVRAADGRLTQSLPTVDDVHGADYTIDLPIHRTATGPARFDAAVFDTDVWAPDDDAPGARFDSALFDTTTWN
ncbi:DUF6519 domain-containing protein [Cryptosporangium sp. NPDC051539]|uniref:DUF6519 domain-containing protein n=1 Tax=Cryptosporangium sp. NPDC051539 TaxID=3363962 RepID=UPI0037BBDE94